MAVMVEEEMKRKDRYGVEKVAKEKVSPFILDLGVGHLMELMGRTPVFPPCVILVWVSLQNPIHWCGWL